MPFEAAHVGLTGLGPVLLQQLVGAAQVILVPGEACEVHVGDVIGPTEVVVDRRQLVPTLLGEPLGFVRFVFPLLCHLFAQPGRPLARSGRLRARPRGLFGHAGADGLPRARDHAGSDQQQQKARRRSNGVRYLRAELPQPVAGAPAEPASTGSWAR